MIGAIIGTFIGAFIGIGFLAWLDDRKFKRQIDAMDSAFKAHRKYMDETYTYDDKELNEVDKR
jgi:hypothetical protein